MEALHFGPPKQVNPWASRWMEVVSGRFSEPQHTPAANSHCYWHCLAQQQRALNFSICRCSLRESLSSNGVDLILWLAEGKKKHQKHKWHMLKKHQTIAYGRQSVLQQLTFLQPLTSLLSFPSLGVGGRVHRVLPPCRLKDTGYVQKFTLITWNYQGRALFLSNYCRICLVAGCKQSMSLHWIMQPDPRLSQQRRMRGMHMISRKTQKKNICYPRSKHPWRWCKVGAPWHIQTSLEWFWQIPRCICPQLQMQPPWQHDRMSRAKVFQVKASHGNPFSVGLAVQARILVALHPGECTRYHCSL